MHRDPPRDVLGSVILLPVIESVLISALAAVHVIRISAIYEKHKGVVSLFVLLLTAQVVVTGVCCAFYFCASLSSFPPLCTDCDRISQLCPLKRVKAVLQDRNTYGSASIGLLPHCCIPHLFVQQHPPD